MSTPITNTWAWRKDMEKRIEKLEDEMQRVTIEQNPQWLAELQEKMVSISKKVDAVYDYYLES